MIEPNPPSRAADAATQHEHGEFDDQAVEKVVREGPSGTWAVAGVATLLVMAMYFAFYLYAYLPRGAVQ